MTASSPLLRGAADGGGGPIQDGPTGDYEALATKSGMLDGFASIALTATLGWGLGWQPGRRWSSRVLIARAALEDVPHGRLARAPNEGRGLIIGISLKLLDLKDVKVGNFLPALVIAGAWCGWASLFWRRPRPPPAAPSAAARAARRRTRRCRRAGATGAARSRLSPPPRIRERVSTASRISSTSPPASSTNGTPRKMISGRRPSGRPARTSWRRR